MSRVVVLCSLHVRVGVVRALRALLCVVHIGGAVVVVAARLSVVRLGEFLSVVQQGDLVNVSLRGALRMLVGVVQLGANLGVGFILVALGVVQLGVVVVPVARETIVLVSQLKLVSCRPHFGNGVLHQLGHALARVHLFSSSTSIRSSFFPYLLLKKIFIYC